MYSLVIDCSHKENFIGLFQDTDSWLCERRFMGQPFEDLVENFNSVITEMGINSSQINHFYTPHSPGSTLGIRVTQMMIQGLLKTCCISAQLSQYNGLYLSALLILETIDEEKTSNYLISENGRHSWNVIKIDDKLKTNPKIEQFESESLSNLIGNFFYIPQMKTWTYPMVNVKELDYSPHQFLKCIKLLDTLKIDSSLLLPQNTNYVKWNQK